MQESIQKKLLRVRPPRVQILYEVETEGSIIIKELPCIIGVVSDLTGFRSDSFPLYNDRKFVFVDPDNFNDILKAYAPRISFSINGPEGKQEIDITFTTFLDFDPLQILKKIPFLNEIYEKRRTIFEFSVKIANSLKLYNIAVEVKKGKSIEEALANYAFFSDDQKTHTIDLFSVIKDLDEDLLISCQQKIADIDKVV